MRTISSCGSGEKLHAEPQLEYAVHNHYRMDEGAQNGLYGCCWFELKELVRAFTRTLVTQKLEDFERALVSEREEGDGARVRRDG